MLSSDVAAEIFVAFLGSRRMRPILFLNRCETLYPALKVGNFKIRGVDKKSTPVSRKVNDMYAATQPQSVQRKENRFQIRDRFFPHSVVGTGLWLIITNGAIDCRLFFRAFFRNYRQLKVGKNSRVFRKIPKF